MADVIVSAVAERLIALLKEQIRNEVNLVRGAEEELRSLSDELKTIRNVLDDAERKGFKNKSVKAWLKELEDLAIEMDDVLDEWNYAVLKLKMERDQSNDAVVAPPKQKVFSFIPSPCLCFKKVVVRHDIARKILNVKEKLDQVLKKKDRYNFGMSQPTDPFPQRQTAPLIDLTKVHGRDGERDNLVSKLIANGGSQRESGFNILSIVGVGGIGKTSLAQLIYDDSRVKEHFELRIWVCVSNPFEVAGVARGIIENVQGSSQNINELKMLLQRVRESILEKRFLLVLDDVWTENYDEWEPLEDSLKCGREGSKILVTTRNERVAKMMGTMDCEICHLGKLSDEDCWLLLRRMAILGRNEEEFVKFQDIGKKIAEKCKGLPLAAKTLGSLLRFKNTLEEWENVLDNEIWHLEEAKVQLFPHLLLSYNELLPILKRCFSYCAVFPKDFKIDVEKLVRIWMALGYLGPDIGSFGEMELKGRECFNNLAMHSLFQDFKKDQFDRQIIKCKMHDIVHDFAQFLRKNGREEAVGMKNTTCQDCKHLLVWNVKEYRSLFLNGSDEVPSKICDCLTSLRVFGINVYLSHNIPQGMEKLIHLRWLDLSGNELSMEYIKTICMLYHLQTLLLCWCHLTGVPWEIGNLIHLRHLDLRGNDMQVLPESIWGLCELQALNVDHCRALCGLPQGINKLVKLKRLHNSDTWSLKQFPEELGQLTGLKELTSFLGGRGWNKLGLLKNLNGLRGSLELSVYLGGDLEEVVADAREAELNQKKHIQSLHIYFKEESIVEAGEKRDELIDALEPHRNLEDLSIYDYKGSKPPRWISSPFNQLKVINLWDFQRISSLPALGELPCLEEIHITEMGELESVGREFLGITATIGGGDIMDAASSSKAPAAAAANTIAFPKLRILEISGCPKWKIWEDISEEEEEESAAMSFMPHLTELYVTDCEELTKLPHRLLRKASSLEKVNIRGSTKLIQHYGDDNGLAWRSLSQNNPGLKLEM